MSKPRFDHAAVPWYAADEPTEPVPLADIARVDRDRLSIRCERWSEAESAVRAPAVVVLAIRPERQVKMAPTPGSASSRGPRPASSR